MNKETIESKLRAKFEAPLPDFYIRRIVFWQDPDRQFGEMIDEIKLPEVQVLKLTGNNNFAAKQLLLETDKESNYLVYNPVSYEDIKDNWLLDIECCSEEFRADMLSMQMDMLHMQDLPELRSALRRYGKFFANKERMAKLSAFGSEYRTSGQLHIDVLAVLTGAAENTPNAVIRALLEAGMKLEENAAMEQIEKFGDITALWMMILHYTGYQYDGEADLSNLAAHLLMSALSVTLPQQYLKAFGRLIDEKHQSACYELINEWMYRDEVERFCDIAEEAAEKLHLADAFGDVETKDLLGSCAFPLIDRIILQRFLGEIAEGVVKGEEILETIQRRRTTRWYSVYENYYEGILHTAKMYRFYQDHMQGFAVGAYEELWESYTKDYHRMDTAYRKFHLAFGKSLRQQESELDDLFKNAADYVENLYKNWYLSTLGTKWTDLTCEDWEQSGCLHALPQQKDFYKDCVEAAAISGTRTYVIISDALRFEVAKELTDQLIQKTKGTAKLSARQGIFPSVTKFGMAALLPHEKLTFTENMNALCDGLSTEGILSREKVLQHKHLASRALSHKDILAMKKTQRREAVAGMDVVYIYHDAIDAIGDKRTTEDQVFEACEDAISELVNLVRLIANDLSGSRIYITADHGFLYSYQALRESDKAESDLISGKILDKDHRYVILEKGGSAEHMVPAAMYHFESEHMGFAPREYIRIKKQGGGVNYVHGGISLQELCVPVIEFQNFRSGAKGFVDTRAAEVKLLSQSRKISNNIFSLEFYQSEAAIGKVLPETYQVFLCDCTGAAISDVQTIIADKTGSQDADRTFRLRFTLKNADYDKKETYYLTICRKDSGEMAEQIGFTIDIAFASEFDF